MLTLSKIRKNAKNAFRLSWGNCVGAYLLHNIVINIVSKVPYAIYLSILLLPFYVGFNYFYLCIYQNQYPKISIIFRCGIAGYGRFIGGVVYQMLFLVLWALPVLIPIVIFPLLTKNITLLYILIFDQYIPLVLLILIYIFAIPAIIKSLSCFATTYLLAEFPDIPITRVLILSKKLTKGHLGEIFLLQLPLRILQVVFPILLAIIVYMLTLTQPAQTTLIVYYLGAIICGFFITFYFGPYMEVAFAGFYEEMKRNALAIGTITPYDLENPSHPFQEPFPPNTSFLKLIT